MLCSFSSSSPAATGDHRFFSFVPNILAAGLLMGSILSFFLLSVVKLVMVFVCQLFRFIYLIEKRW